MDLHPRAAVRVAAQLRRDAGMAVQRQHLLDLQPDHRHGVDGHVERLTACGKGDLGECSSGQDGLAVHLVVGQPWAHVCSDVGLPDVVTARRQFHVGAEQGMAAVQIPEAGSVGHPER